MPGRRFRRFVEEKLGKFPHFLLYAILEFVVIILLFIDGFLAFLSNEIARFFELKIPCLLCTRIDHVLVHRNSNFYYNDSICEVHKKDISSLAFCHMHKKLSDIRSMCQGCLLSFSAEKDSDLDRYKSLVEILHKDADGLVEDDRKLVLKPLKKYESEILSDEKTGIPRCSCCGESSKSKPSSKYKRNLSMNTPAPAPSPRSHFFSKRSEEGGSMDLLQMRYTELKLMADAESELPEYEDAMNADNSSSREDAKASALPLLPDSGYLNEDVPRTPVSARGNKFFGISLSDSAHASPRWSNRAATKLQLDNKLDFIFETNDGNESDGDILSRLRCQVHLYRKSLMALHMELDEERSASAVAANNAMAMITRLQAEKAAVQMEGLQYQRMMDEQAEYDQEAFQAINDLLLKREEDVKALEAELEAYREHHGDIKKIGNEICEVNADEEDYQETKSQTFSPLSESGSSSGPDQNENERPCTEYVGGYADESLVDFERHRCYLLRVVRELEEQLNISPSQVFKSSELFTGKNEYEGRGNENEELVIREVSRMKERIRAIEAESGFLKHAALVMQQGNDGIKLLNEIAHHLRRLRQPVISLSDCTQHEHLFCR